MEAIDTNGSITFRTDATLSLLKITDTGKGLTLVRDILRNHGFDFSLKTLAPHQTTFTIKF